MINTVKSVDISGKKYIITKRLSRLVKQLIRN